MFDIMSYNFSVPMVSFVIDTLSRLLIPLYFCTVPALWPSHTHSNLLHLLQVNIMYFIREMNFHIQHSSLQSLDSD